MQKGEVSPDDGFRKELEGKDGQVKDASVIHGLKGER